MIPASGEHTLKILVLSNLYPPEARGGYEQGCREAVEALRARGHQTTVLTSIPKRRIERQSDVRRELQLTDLWEGRALSSRSPITDQLAWTAGILVNDHNVHVLLNALEDVQPDVVYVWMTIGLGGLALIRTLKHLNVPWVWHLMDDVPLVLSMPTPRARHRSLLRSFGKRPRGTYIACSKRLVDEIQAGGIDIGDRVEIIPNWVTGSTPCMRPSNNSGCLRIMFAGQIARHKGVDLLIESAALLRDRGHQRFVIDLYGDAVDPQFQAQIKRLRLRNHVRLKGSLPREQLLDQYSNYDVLAFPTWEREPFAFAPLEAALRGCVPIIPRVCGNAEWMIDGVHLIKTHRTAEAFAHTFEAILRKQIDLAPIRARGAALVRRDFHLDTMIERIEHVLRSAARPWSFDDSRAAAIHKQAAQAQRRATAMAYRAFCA